MTWNIVLKVQPRGTPKATIRLLTPSPNLLSSQLERWVQQLVEDIATGACLTSHATPLFGYLSLAFLHMVYG